MVEAEAVWSGKVFGKTGRASLAEKVPGVKNSTNPKTMNQRLRIRSCVGKLTDHVIRHPSQAVEIWASVDSEDLVAEVSLPANDAATSASDTFSTVTTMGKLSQTAKATVLVAMPGGPDIDLLNKMNDCDPRAIHDIFYVAFRYSPQDRIPECARTAVIFILMSKVRLDEVGFDLAQWFDKCVDLDTGAVDWTACPLFSFHWRDQRLHEVVHCRRQPVIAAVPLRLSIPEGSPLNDFLSDDGAYFVVDDEKHFVYNWFAKGTGPHEFRLDKVGVRLGNIAEACKVEVENKVNAARALTDVASETVCLDQRLKRQRAAALENARMHRHKPGGRVLQHVSPVRPSIADVQAADPPADLVMQAPEGSDVD